MSLKLIRERKNQIGLSQMQLRLTGNDLSATSPIKFVLIVDYYKMKQVK